jgi:hypothetical protein
MEKEFISGQMVDSTADSGGITKWKAEVFSPGLIIEDMKVSTMMTKKKDMECSSGLMVVDMKESGKMENSMELVCIQAHQGSKERVNGEKAREWLGSNEINDDLEIYEFKYKNYNSYADMLCLKY